GRNDRSIFLNESDNLGPAMVVFVPGMPPDVAKLKAVEESVAELTVTFKEKTFTYTLKSGDTKVADLDGLPGWKIEIKGYYPDFVITEEGFRNRSKRPLRPAVYFELVGPEVMGVADDPADPHGGGHGGKQD